MALLGLPTMATAIQPAVENETASYSKEGIVISADVLRKPATPVSVPRPQSAPELIPEENASAEASPPGIHSANTFPGGGTCPGHHHPQLVYLPR